MRRGDSGIVYPPVRALARGVEVLRALNYLGRARPAELAAATKIDRTTTYRLLATLETLGLIERSASDDEYVLRAAVRELSEGFTERDRTMRVVATQLGVLFPRVLWPTDFAQFERGAMVIRETTHRFSPYSIHRAMVGQPRGLFTSSLGRAALVAANPAQRRVMIEIAQGSGAIPPSPWTSHDKALKWMISDFQQRGYAFSVGEMDSRMSAIALPLAVETGPAAINLVFFRSAMAIEVAAERFLPALTDCVAAIHDELAKPSVDQEADISASPAGMAR